MKITFLGQGFKSESVNATGNYLIEYLNQKEFHSFIGFSAFASEAGIFGLSEHLTAAKKNFKNLTIVVGIDQHGTSKEALEEILNLNVRSYIFYQKELPIFHPKIYLFEGDKNFKLIIGSSNLTSMGLFSNIESSLLIEFDLNDPDGLKLLEELKNYYKSVFDFTDPNLFRIDGLIIEKFFLEGIVLTEVDRRRLYDSKVVKKTTKIDSAEVSMLIPKRDFAPVPRTFKKKQKSYRTSAYTSDETKTTNEFDEKSSKGSLDKLLILWESGPLTKRDLTIPERTNTHQTGSMLFKKGKTQGIDQRHYFRDDVFSALPWAFEKNPKSSHLERATAFFQILIMGIDHGTFSLLITHNSKTDTKSYKQKNSMTSLAWGNARSSIAKEELIGLSAFLYKSEDQSNKFILVIE